MDSTPQAVLGRWLIEVLGENLPKPSKDAELKLIAWEIAWKHRERFTTDGRLSQLTAKGLLACAFCI